MLFAKYIRSEVFPTPFCQGCGHGILMQAILRAIAESQRSPDYFGDELSLDVNKIVFVSGIGCAAWIPSPHFAADTLHTTHGRAIAFATGVKLFNPALKVIVVSGDGDLSAIGGNHLIHAARRNIELTVICANNSIYGMTGGQVAPTTPCGAKTTTTPTGSSEPPFDLCKLVKGAGATYIARSTVYHIRELIKYIKKALTHKGFSFIDTISPCYTQFGRRNQKTCGSSPAKMLLNLKKICVRVTPAADLSATGGSARFADLPASPTYWVTPEGQRGESGQPRRTARRAEGTGKPEKDCSRPKAQGSKKKTLPTKTPEELFTFPPSRRNSFGMAQGSKKKTASDNDKDKILIGEFS